MAQENNCIIVIFGASGDLTKRKLMPAIYALYRQGLLPKKFAILGASRSPYSDEAFRKKIVSDIKTYASLKRADQKQLGAFSKHLYYQSLDATDINHYEELKKKLSILKTNPEKNMRYRVILQVHVQLVSALL